MNPKYAAVALVGAFTLAGCGGSGNGAVGWSKLAVLAGQIGSGPGVADGNAKAARFDFPQGLHTATDGSGALFIVDSANNTIRRMTIDGTVATIAGSPFAYGTADGTGAAARFSFPTDITDDGLGTLYVADADNHCIRKIVAGTGVVTTLAGQCGVGGALDGIGAAAQFIFPSGLTLIDGNLYVADESTVRRVEIATGTVVTVAGDPSSTVSVGVDGVGTAALFSSLWGITNDGAGNLFMTDLSANQVRQMVIATGAVSTIAGNGTASYVDGVGMAATFNFPQGVAADRLGNLYVADVDNNIVRKIVLATNTVSTLAGSATPGSADGIGGAAGFYEPSGLDFGSGSLRVADA
ncbi:MAG TPA: hypothetical protein VHB97_17355, partial [Polyangia bacterium]|nr:hypothetical protein [Polyangia bacterium]